MSCAVFRISGSDMPIGFYNVYRCRADLSFRRRGEKEGGAGIVDRIDAGPERKDRPQMVTEQMPIGIRKDQAYESSQVRIP